MTQEIRGTSGVHGVANDREEAVRAFPHAVGFVSSVLPKGKDEPIADMARRWLRKGLTDDAVTTKLSTLNLLVMDTTAQKVRAIDKAVDDLWKATNPRQYEPEPETGAGELSEAELIANYERMARDYDKRNPRLAKVCRRRIARIRGGEAGEFSDAERKMFQHSPEWA